MFLRKVLPSVSLLLAHALLARAGEVTNIPKIDAHHPILIVEKNVNPQNKMVIYTKVNADGGFATDPNNRHRPVLGFYWLMDGRKYKPVHPLIKSEIRKRFVNQWSARAESNRFTVSVNDLKEVNCDIEEPRMDVYARGAGRQQRVEAEMDLGPSDGHMRIRLSSIYTEGRAFPPAVHSVTLIGRRIVNGNVTDQEIKRKYVASR